MNNKRKMEYEFSPGVRWTHWIRAVSIAILTFTGFYISYVFVAPEVSNKPVLFMNGKFRMFHEIFGFLLIAVLIYKSFLFLFSRQSKTERISILNVLNPMTWIRQIKFYLFLGEHPHLKGVYNPLQFASYLFMYVVFFLICLTGLVLYVHVFHEGLGGMLYEFLRPLEAMMGGLANVREFHHILMWAIIIFLPIHIYMAIFNSVINKDGSMDTIISGYRFNETKKDKA